MATPTDSAVVEANRALGRHFFEEQDRLRGGPAPALCAPGYSALIGSYPLMNREQHERFAAAFYEGFSGISHEVSDVFATDDRVAVRFVIRGTHTGSFFGIPATGHSIVVPAHVMMRVANGQVTELQGVFDEAGLLRQLGVLQG